MLTTAAPIVVRDMNNDGKINVYDSLLAQGKFLRGDVNKDFRVNIIDLARVGRAFGTAAGSAKYDKDADLNGDNKIDIHDIATVGANIKIATTSGSTTLSVSPSTNTIGLGQQLTINIDIATTEGIYAVQFNVSYNRAILEVVGISEGNFLKSDGQQTFWGNITEESASAIQFYDTRLGDVPGMTGSGTLVSISFRSKDYGSSILDLNDDIVLNYSLEKITATLNDGSVNVVRNQPPVAVINGPYVGNEGSLIPFSSSGSYDPDGNITSYFWTFGDGSNSALPNPTHSYADNGFYTVTLTVTDDYGMTNAATTNVTVRNVAPTVTSLVGPATAPRNTVVQFNATFTDPGADTWTCVWSFGDGPATAPLACTSSLIINHQYNSKGNFVVTLNVTDDDGGAGTKSTSILIQDQPPVAVANGPYSGNEGSLVPFSSSGSYDPDGAITSYLWNFGDGATSSLPNPTHSYADNGFYTITLTVTDNDGTTNTATTNVTIRNVVPTVTSLVGPATALRNTNVRFNATFTDPGADTWTCMWNFGDGGGVSTPCTSPNIITHTYVSLGNYTVTLNVTDDDGGSGTKVTSIMVTSTLPNIIVDAGPDASRKVNMTVQYHGSYADSKDTSPYIITWNFGDGQGMTTNFNLTPSHKYQSVGLFTVTLNVTASDGRSAKDFMAVNITPPTFPDVPAYYWAYPWIEATYAAKIVQGYPDGTYQPEQNVTRAQMAVYIAKSRNLSTADVPPCGKENFTDVACNYWAYVYIEAVRKAGIVTGYPDGTYRPEQNVTRSQMAVYIAKAKLLDTSSPPACGSESFIDVKCTYWAYNYIEAVKKAGIVSGYPDGTYQPEVIVTRGQMAVYIARAFNLDYY